MLFNPYKESTITLDNGMTATLRLEDKVAEYHSCSFGLLDAEKYFLGIRETATKNFLKAVNDISFPSNTTDLVIEISKHWHFMTVECYISGVTPSGKFHIHMDNWCYEGIRVTFNGYSAVHSLPSSYLWERDAHGSAVPYKLKWFNKTIEAIGKILAYHSAESIKPSVSTFYKAINENKEEDEDPFLF